MTPTPDQIAQALQHVRYEIESFLQTPEYDRSNETLEESVEFRRMAHCRVLYEFFKTSAEDRQKDRRKEDSMISDDFDFKTRVLNDDNFRTHLQRINKDLLHLTYDRLNRTTLEDKRWHREVLFPPVEQWSKEFIEHIVKHCAFGESAELTRWTDLKAAVAAQPPPPLQQSTSNVAPSQTLVIEGKRGS